MTLRCPLCGGGVEQRFIFNYDSGSVSAAGHQAHLTRMQCDVLQALIDAQGKPVSVSALIGTVYGLTAPLTALYSLSAAIADMRRRLEPLGILILNPGHGFGYVLSQKELAPVEPKTTSEPDSGRLKAAASLLDQAAQLLRETGS